MKDQIKREDVGVAYITYMVPCPNCKENIFLLASDVKKDLVQCDHCDYSHELSGNFDEEIGHW